MENKNLPKGGKIYPLGREREKSISLAEKGEYKWRIKISLRDGKYLPRERRRRSGVRKKYPLGLGRKKISLREKSD